MSATFVPSGWVFRLCTLLMLGGVVWFVPWMLLHLNGEQAVSALAYAIANLVVCLNLVLTATNNWVRERPPPFRLRAREPLVGVLIPTFGEPLAMLERTVRSVLEQDWPGACLRIVVSDDAHRADVATLVDDIQLAYSGASVWYHEPESRQTRRGDGKSGNLNSALARLSEHVGYVETRDADDEVGDPHFLRECVGQLEHDERLAFVQTIKTAAVSRGDPFNNREPIFYHEVMPGKHAANAVFPCGSGVVWRRGALREIGEFPTWNLVEDLQSGVEALRRGWHGAYLPIVGARAQHAPEDMPNFYKQRGTWALDTIRLLLWGNLTGLGLRQRLQFIEMGVWYIQGLCVWALSLLGAAWLIWDVSPLRTDPNSFALHFVPFLLGAELFLVGFKGAQSYGALWRTRELGIGLAPVFLRALVVAVVAGGRRKPAYRVTRKEHAFAVYWREVSPHIAMLVLVVGGFLYGLLIRHHPYAFSPATIYWVLVFTLLVGRFVTKSWFGVSFNWSSALGALAGTGRRRSERRG